MRSFRRPGFTIIELLVVIAVIAVLAALLLPAVQQIRESSRRTQCRNNLRQLGLGFTNYETTNRVYPPSIVRQEDGNPPPPSVPFAALRYRGHWTGYHMLLPYIGQNVLYGKYNFDDTWISPLNNPTDHKSWPLNQTPIPILICPSSYHGTRIIGGDAGGNVGHWMAGAPADYSFSHGADIIRGITGEETGCPEGLLHFWSKYPRHLRGPFGHSSSCRTLDIEDGLSHSIFLGEKTGGLLTYSGWSSGMPTLSMEYPWAMAAIEFIAVTGDKNISNSAWLAGPFASTYDMHQPNCASSPISQADPYPMNPSPRDVALDSDERPFYSFQSPHAGGAHFLFADGHVSFLNESINQATYGALSTIQGSEPLDDF